MHWHPYHHEGTQESQSQKRDVTSDFSLETKIKQWVI